jgi:hypothetical protein
MGPMLSLSICEPRGRLKVVLSNPNKRWIGAISQNHMSLTLKKSTETQPFFAPELGVEAVKPARVDSNLDLDGDNGLTDNGLTNELDRILARKPIARPTNGVAKPANSNWRDSDVTARDNDGFAWVPEIELDEETQASAAQQATASAASAAWLAKARQDKRGKSRRNAVAWAATIMISVLVLVASAYLLTGWTPDFSGFKQVAAIWSPVK